MQQKMQEYLKKMEKANEDVERIKKEIEKQVAEQQEELGKDVFLAMVTADQFPNFKTANKMKSFIGKERTKKDNNSDFLNGRVNTFFTEKIKEAKEKESESNYDQLLKKLDREIQEAKEMKEQNPLLMEKLKEVSSSRPFTAFSKMNRNPSSKDSQST